MERSKYNRSGGGTGRGRGGGRSVSGGGRDGSGGGRGGSGERAGNNYQQYHRQYQTGGGDGGRRGGWGGRDRKQMGRNPSPAQPWGYQGRFAMGQGAGATRGTGVCSGGPRAAGRGFLARDVEGGAGAGQAPRRILPLFLFLSLFLALSLYPLSQLFTMLPLLPIGDEWRCSLLLQLHHQLLSHHLHMRLHWTMSSTEFNPSRYSKVRSAIFSPSK